MKALIPMTFSGQVTSLVATGTAPLSISSTTLVPNLNAEMVGSAKVNDAGTDTASLWTASKINTQLGTKSALAHTHSLTVNGDISGTVSLDNTADTMALTLATVATAGTYKSVTINAKGLVTAGTNPTTLAGYGITDAATLTHAHSLTVNGDISGTVSMDNTADIMTLTLPASGVTAGTYTKLTVNAKGLVTVGAALASADVTTALGYTPVNKAGDIIDGSNSSSSLTIKRSAATTHQVSLGLQTTDGTTTYNGFIGILNGVLKFGTTSDHTTTGNTIWHSGNITPVAKGGDTMTGKLSVPSFQVGTVATAGQVLTADASGNATWQAVSATGTFGRYSIAYNATEDSLDFMYT